MNKCILCFFLFACCLAQEVKIFGQWDNLFPREEIMDFDSEPEDVEKTNKAELYAEQGSPKNNL